jgi:hypothetical protein
MNRPGLQANELRLPRLVHHRGTVPKVRVDFARIQHSQGRDPS